MKISSLSIKNFKNIHELSVQNVDQAMILVGKNNAGKTIILYALLAVVGKYKVKESDFNDSPMIEIGLTLKLEEEDLRFYYENGVICRYRKQDSWKNYFMSKLPSYQENSKTITFRCLINKEGQRFFEDGFKKHNRYIEEILPQIYYLDNTRNLAEIQKDFLSFFGNQSLLQIEQDKCNFDKTKHCNRCFDCIGMINKKAPENLTAQETMRLLEYKIVKANINDFADRVNYYFHKNNGLSQDIKYELDINLEEAFHMETQVLNRDRKTEGEIETLSAGTKSIYILSLLEAYIEQVNSVKSIILIEDPEIYLHPQLQKMASEILYRLSKKNQVIFTTHSPNMMFNFASKQIKQVVIDKSYSTVVNENVDINEILEDLGYNANDFMNVSFVFIVEGKQDSNRLPLLLKKYYSEIYDENGTLKRISIIPTNSCTNIKTYANLKYINKLYLKDQFLMIRDSDGKNPRYLVKQLCNYYEARAKEEEGNVPRVLPKNVLILKYYSFENYFLDPQVLTKIGVLKNEEDFYRILYEKYQAYLYKIPSMKRMTKMTGARIHSKEDIKRNMESIKKYVRGHNLFDIFYGRYRQNGLNEILQHYIDIAPRETFADILDSIDRFVYFESRKKEEA